MDALVQFFTAVAVALAATVFAHIGAAAGGGFDLRAPQAESQRSIERSPSPCTQPAPARQPC